MSCLSSCVWLTSLAEVLKVHPGGACARGAFSFRADPPPSSKT